jgi:hypothetical protein
MGDKFRGGFLSVAIASKRSAGKDYGVALDADDGSQIAGSFAAVLHSACQPD